MQMSIEEWEKQKKETERYLNDRYMAPLRFPIENIKTGNVNINTLIDHVEQLNNRPGDRGYMLLRKLHQWKDKLEGEQKEEFIKFFEL